MDARTHDLPIDLSLEHYRSEKVPHEAGVRVGIHADPHREVACHRRFGAVPVRNLAVRLARAVDDDVPRPYPARRWFAS